MANRRVMAVVAAAVVVASAGLGACGKDSGSGASATTSGTATTRAGAGAPPSVADPDTGTDTGTGTKGEPYPSAITDQQVVNPKFEPLMADIDRRLAATGLPGAGLLVLEDGKLVQQQTTGGYDLDTQIPIASASKWMSGVTIMTLVDEGLVELDEPISTYLSGAKGRPGTITLRQLLSFTSGLQYDEKIPCYADWRVSLADCTDQILALPLLGAPGTGYRYTGTHLFVAGAVAEAVTGQTWEQIFQERVAEPLGMDHTTFLNPRYPDPAPDGHPQPAGSGRSTLGDYGRFLEMVVHDGVAPSGARIISTGSLAEMSTVQTGDAEFVSASEGRRQAKTPYGLAHWLDVVDADDKALLESSPGAFGFRPWIDSVNGIAGVYMVEDRRDREAEAVQASGSFVVDATAKALGVKSPT